MSKIFLLKLMTEKIFEFFIMDELKNFAANNLF